MRCESFARKKVFVIMTGTVPDITEITQNLAAAASRSQDGQKLAAGARGRGTAKS
jgi:hypothetical protein